jgi:hypothetical protein
MEESDAEVLSLLAKYSKVWKEYHAPDGSADHGETGPVPLCGHSERAGGLGVLVEGQGVDSRRTVGHVDGANKVNHLDNVRAVLEKADHMDLRDGLLAYPRHNATLSRLAAHYGASVPGTVAAFCALSPNNDYIGNLRSTVTLLRGFRDGLAVEDLTVSTYKACARRAWRCLQGEDFLSFTEGKKTRAFYQNIMDPSDPFPVTIDGHMMSVWCAKRMTMKEAVMRRMPYDEIAEGIRIVAGERGMIPNRLQSILWFTWKRLHNILYRPQMDLFKCDDPWLMDLEPDEIRGFNHTRFPK